MSEDIEDLAAIALAAGNLTIAVVVGVPSRLNESLQLAPFRAAYQLEVQVSIHPIITCALAKPSGNRDDDLGACAYTHFKVGNRAGQRQSFFPASPIVRRGLTLLNTLPNLPGTILSCIVTLN